MRFLVRIAVLTILWLLAGSAVLWTMAKRSAPPAESPEIFTQLGHSGPAGSLEWSPGGETLATAGADGMVKLWQADSGRLLRTIAAHKLPVRFASWSPDGRTLASASLDHTVKLWEPRAGKLLRTLSTAGDLALSVKWSPDGRLLAVTAQEPDRGEEQQHVIIWRVDTGARLQTFGEEQDFTHSVAWSPDGRTLATCGGNVKLWSADSGKLLETLPYHETNWFHHAVWSPDGKTLATIGPGKLRLWQMTSGFPHRDLTNQPNDRNDSSAYDAAAWSPDGQRIAMGGTKVSVWQVASGALLRQLPGDSMDYLYIAWSPDGKTIAGAAYEGPIRLWDAQTGALRRVLSHADSVYALTWSPDGKTLASGSEDGTVKFWNPAAGSLSRSVEAGIGVVHTLVWSPEGGSLAGGGDKPNVTLWDGQTGAVQRTFATDSGPVKSVTWSPDGKALAAAYHEGIRLWDRDSGEAQRTFSTGASSDGNGGVQYIPLGADAVTWSSDGLTLAAGNGTVDLFAASGKHLENFSKMPSGSHAVAFRPHGRTLAIACAEGQLSLWEAGLDRIIPPGANFWFEPTMMTNPRNGAVKAHRSRIEAVAWSRDGALVATAHTDGTLQIWNGDTGAHVRSLEGHTGYVQAVAWSPDGRNLASGGEDGTIRLWDVATGELQLTTTLLPENEWITMAPKKLWYASSANGDEYAALRFAGWLEPAFPLRLYRGQLRRSDPRQAGEYGEVRPDLQYLAEGILRDKRPWAWGWVGLYVVALGAVRVAGRKRQ